MSNKHTGDKHASHNALGVARPLGTGAVLVMIGLCSIWGMGQIAIKIGNQGISPLWQAGLRSVGASLIILAWMALRGIPIRPIPGRWKWRLLIGAAFASEFICLYIGIGLTTAAHATLLLYSAPFFVALGSHLLLNDRLNRTRIIGLVLAFAGVGLALGGAGNRSAGEATLLGDALCLAAGLGWAGTTLILRASPLKSEPPERTLLDQLSVSAVILLAASVIAGEPGIFAPSPMVWAAFAYQTVMVASISYLGWFVMVQRYSPASVSTFSFITPVFGVIFAVLTLGEAPTLSVLLALVLIAAGIRMVNKG
jgi:drug/metabolite transporter (DMT)-like permease